MGGEKGGRFLLSPPKNISRRVSFIESFKDDTPRKYILYPRSF